MTDHFVNWFARWSLFIVYFWFGILKIFNLSPANPLISALLERTLPFVTFEQFIVLLGIFEMVIGVLFLVPKLQKVVLVLFGLHLVMITAPFVLLPTIAWQRWFVPTLEGQYMIKNILMVALVLTLVHTLEKPRVQ
jgi:uncharacterized membrane protein YkgB